MAADMNDIYMNSEILKSKIKYSPSLGLVVVDEKNSLNKRITYTLDELEIVKETGVDELPLEVHTMKKLFAGTIVRYTAPEK